MPNGLPLEQKAQVLAESDYATDKEVAGRWKIGVRTLENYRSQLKTDPNLLAEYHKQKTKLSVAWVDDASKTIKVCAETVQDLCKKKNPKHALLIQSVAGAAKIFGELNIAYTALTDEPSPDSESTEAKKA
ncbi:MAG: hypothetical protein AAGA46_03105 [Cyanobacteria bacterium P01_F01_bin.13]